MATIINKISFTKQSQKDFGKEYIKSYYLRPEGDQGFEEYLAAVGQNQIDNIGIWIERINKKDIWIEELITNYSSYQDPLVPDPLVPDSHEILQIIVFTSDSKIEDEKDLREGNNEFYDKPFDDGIDISECPYEIHLIGLSVKKLVINESY